jgi:hypothetical protein
MSDLPGAIVLLVMAAVFVTTVIACVRDARRRGKSPVLVTLLVLLSFPLGLVLWLLFRPEPIDPPDENEPFRLEDHRVQ